MKKLPMRKIREVLRLKFEHQFSERRIARSCNISRSTVSDYLTRFKAAIPLNDGTNMVSRNDSLQFSHVQPLPSAQKLIHKTGLIH